MENGIKDKIENFSLFEVKAPANNIGKRQFAGDVLRRMTQNNERNRQKEQQLRRLFNAKCSIQLDKDDSGFWRSW